MASVSRLGEAVGLTGRKVTDFSVTLNATDYGLFFVYGSSSLSLAAASDSSGPDLTLLASATNNPTIDFYVYGAQGSATTGPPTTPSAAYYSITTSGSWGMCVYRIRPATGETVSLKNSVQILKESKSTFSITTSQELATGDIVFGFQASEGYTFLDADSTNGLWVRSDVIGLETPEPYKIVDQYKIATGRGTQTLNGSTPVSEKIIYGLVSFDVYKAGGDYWGVAI